MNYTELICKIEAELKNKFAQYEEVSLSNQEKVLNAFISCRVSSIHFANTTGYGYGDIGREKLGEVFAKVFNAESAIVSPHFASGTHAISTALFGLLRPKDRVLCISGMPYDTLKTVIFGKNIGSLADFGIEFDVIPLKNGNFDEKNIYAALNKPYSAVYIQRSAGYERRSGFSISKLRDIISVIKKLTNCPVIVDNCYGEFVEEREPTDVGADIIIGSLIKNPGGALAPTGGYIAGSSELIKTIGMRLTAPGIGTEVGSYENSYRNFFQGLFVAPHVVCQAKKGGLLIAAVMEKLGYKVYPSAYDIHGDGDIVKVIDFNDKDKMIKFCQAVQASSPIDSFAAPEPWAMPGYENEIIMASGSFVQGSSIELSADAPVKPPYSLYIQGGITYEHTKIALMRCLKTI